MKALAMLLAAGIAAALLTVGQPARDVRSSPSTTRLSDFVGVNAVVNDLPADIATVAGWVRDYHKWYWYESTEGQYTWSTGWQHLDTFYQSLTSLGVSVMPDVEFAPGWATSNGRIDGVPDPAKHARYMGAMVTHFRGTLAAVENYNEPNQTWQLVRFPANQFGSMTAQDYAAVKAANPNLTFVLAGMAGPDTTYLDQAAVASGGAFDVVNFHWYSVGDTIAGGLNPESGSLANALQWVGDWRNTRAPRKPIWITEFGWDTSLSPGGGRSKIYAPESDAANYLLRSFVLMQAGGVERAFTYIYRDPTSSAAGLGTQYNSAGLVTDASEHDGRRKVGWYYLATLKSVLGDYVFDRVVSAGPNVYDYEYVVPGTGQRAAVMWARNGSRDSGYRTNYLTEAGTLVVPTDGSTTGAVSTTDGNLVLSERPVIVVYNAQSVTPTPTRTPVAGTPTPTATLVSTSTPTPTRTPAAGTPTPTATLVSTSTPTPTATAGGGRNVLVDGDFEHAFDNWFVPGWYAGVVSAEGGVTHAGNGALGFSGSASGPYIYQDVPASAGQVVRFSGWVNVPAAGGDGRFVVELVARHSSNGDLQTFRVVDGASSSGWQEVSGSATMPARTSSVRVRVRYQQLKGTAYFDDFSLSVDP